MNYKGVYDRLVENARSRVNSLGDYLEKHHILPRCLGGCDAFFNLVEFTPREHFIAHLLLLRIHPREDRLAFAAHMMAHTRDGVKVSGRTYDFLRRAHGQAMSRIRSGTRLDETTKLKISTANTGRKRSEESVEKGASKLRGVARSQEFKDNVSLGKRGTKLSDQHKMHISLGGIGKVRSEETRRNISNAKKGKSNGRIGYKHSDETRKKIAEKTRETKMLNKLKLEKDTNV